MINEIFESVQGEGLNAGEKQIFIRFSGCNLNCSYCDTKNNVSNFSCSENELFDKIKFLKSQTISLTGGEPLLKSDFIKSFLSKYKGILKKNIYLETNGTLYKELEKTIDYIDLIGMDIKIKSACKEENRFDLNEKFLNISREKAFIKVVFDKNITDSEINTITNLAAKFNNCIILQPKMPLEKNTPYIQIFDKFYNRYKNIRLIPQMHKFLDIK